MARGLDASSMLDSYRLSGLHMKDFVRPRGKNIGLYPEFKVAIFSEAVKIITRKHYSLSVSVRNAEFQRAITTEFYRKYVGAYTACFITLAMMNAKIANDNNYPDKVAYVVDQGSPFAEQLRVGHLMVAAYENSHGPKVRTGGLMFADDVDISALQGADLIAWTVGRKVSGDGIRDEFVPLLNIFEKRFDVDGHLIRPHIHYEVEDDLTERIMADLAVNGDAQHQKAMAAIQALVGDGV
jgi:hypothetical protein